MHDPMTVAHEIRRPWPSKPRRARSGERFRQTIHRRHAADYEGWNPRRWWRPHYWSPFTTVFGWEFYWPSLVTIWHVEPGGRDSGAVCKHRKGDKVSDAWRWHVWHWRLTVRPTQKLKRWAFSRCQLCGRRFPYGYAPVSNSWDGPGPKWFRNAERVYHFECSDLEHSRRTRGSDRKLIRELWAWIVLETGKTDEELLEGLRATDWGFGRRYRLESIIGFDRDEDNRLVRSADAVGPDDG